MASPPPSPIAASPTFGPMSGTRRVDDSECPKFRILIIGRSGTGKSSLINAIFRASLVDIKHGRAGSADINKGITSDRNKHLVIHESEGFEPGNWDKIGVLKKFIKERGEKERYTERLHAIWLCVTMPPSGGPTLEEWHEKMLELRLIKVPIIIVYTKFDLRTEARDGDGKELTERSFKQKYGQMIERSMNHATRQIPYAVVTTSRPETMQDLVQTTMKSIRHVNAEIPSPFIVMLHDTGFWGGRSSTSEEDLAEVALATAQRVDTASKVAASIKRGKKKYWIAIVSGIHFLGLSLRKCLFKMHKDIVTIWNIPNLEEYLLSDDFCRRMMAVVDDLVCQTQTNTHGKQGKIPRQGVASLATGWANNLYNRVPEHIRCLIGYAVDLTLILQAVFIVSLEDVQEKDVTQDRVNEIIYGFYYSEKRKRIHNAIWEFARTRSPSTKDNVADKIESLIYENQMTKKDIQIGQSFLLPLLLTIIRFELTAKGQIVNRTTLQLMRKPLDLQQYDSIVSELKADSDIQLLLDFMLYLFSHSSLSQSGIQDGNKKARRLMFELTSKKNIIPKAIFITDEVTPEVDSHDLAIGGLGRIFRGDHNGQKVSLRMLSRDHKHGSVREVQSILAWRSLVHRHVLTLLGIFELKPQLFLVSPYMPSGTLSQWRENNQESGIVDKIQRMMREVAEGVEYIHSEGIVHCDLRGENIFLDSDLRCQIADIGLTQYTDSFITFSGSDYQFNYAAPELFLVLSESDRRDGDHDMHGGSETTETDVYAFGCLYYAAFFDTVPFKGKPDYEIMRVVTTGGRPGRLQNPEMEDDIWNLIKDCWRDNPSERPSMRHIAEKLEVLLSSRKSQSYSTAATSHSLATPDEVHTPVTSTYYRHGLQPVSLSNQMIKNCTLRLINKLFEPCEPDMTFSRSVLESSLDSLLHLLRSRSLTDPGIQDAKRKARQLMVELASKKKIIPKSLLITGVTEMQTIGGGAFARVYKGEHKGRRVAVKMVEKGRDDDSLIKDFYREAVMWQSLSHRFILPLLGIYEEKSQLCLVSPLMENETLSRWRMSQDESDVDEFHRMMLEIAEGIQYLHAEGIVHGDLHGKNVLLDSEFHCKITDFGLTRHIETVVSHSTRAFCLNYAAPELFGLCVECGDLACGGCYKGHETHHVRKTMETDVYAFGCLYYTVLFGVPPFHDKYNSHIMGLVTRGVHPDRLDRPRIDDNMWGFITSCWARKPSERPTMDEIVVTLKSRFS